MFVVLTWKFRSIPLALRAAALSSCRFFILFAALLQIYTRKAWMKWVPIRKVLGNIGKKYKAEQARTRKSASKHTVRRKKVYMLPDIAGVGDKWHGVASGVPGLELGDHSSFSKRGCGAAATGVAHSRSLQLRWYLCGVQRGRTLILFCALLSEK